MKTLTKLSLFLFTTVLLFACNKAANAKKVQTENNGLTTVIEKETYIIPTNYPLEVNGPWRKICTTNILEDNVNIRNYPSLEAAIVYQLKKDTIVEIQGFSHENTTVDGFEGNWVYVFYTVGNVYEEDNIEGWVFSKYVNIGDIKASPIRFVEMSGTDVKISYKIADEEVFKDVRAIEQGPYTFNKGVHVTKEGDYYVFIWGPYEYQDYHYSTIPGVYILTADTHELKHITYFGAFEDGGHAWTEFLNGFEYLIQDSGTGPGVRHITAWRLRDMKRVFDGSYYKNYYLNNHSIRAVYFCDPSSDEEIMSYGKAYMENNPLPQDIKEEGLKEGIPPELMIDCSIDLETGERKILGGRYMLIF